MVVKQRVQMVKLNFDTWNTASMKFFFWKRYRIKKYKWTPLVYITGIRFLKPKQLVAGDKISGKDFPPPPDISLRQFL